MAYSAATASYRFAPSTSCPTEIHEDIKADDIRWLAETIPVGIQKDHHGRPILALRNCHSCGSTLGRRIRP